MLKVEIENEIPTESNCYHNHENCNNSDEKIITQKKKQIILNKNSNEVQLGITYNKTLQQVKYNHLKTKIWKLPYFLKSPKKSFQSPDLEICFFLNNRIRSRIKHHKHSHVE